MKVPDSYFVLFLIESHSNKTKSAIVLNLECSGAKSFTQNQKRLSHNHEKIQTEN